eukprot:1380409-Amphidinium_carterae.1
MESQKECQHPPSMANSVMLETTCCVGLGERCFSSKTTYMLDVCIYSQVPFPFQNAGNATLPCVGPTTQMPGGRGA